MKRKRAVIAIGGFTLTISDGAAAYRATRLASGERGEQRSLASSHCKHLHEVNFTTTELNGFVP
jgi:hypothetical protein